MFNPIKSRTRKVVDSYYVTKILVNEFKVAYKYEKMIAESQAKIGEYKPAPFVPVVIA